VRFPCGLSLKKGISEGVKKRDKSIFCMEIEEKRGKKQNEKKCEKIAENERKSRVGAFGFKRL
jgi:hypothetical protein